MQEIIASFDCSNITSHPACSDVFYRGVRIIEKEYQTTIHCDLVVNSENNMAELLLLDAPRQTWFTDSEVREKIVYKLSTHLKICLAQFSSGNDNVSIA